MPKIIIQAGHQGRTTGATGAPGEREFTTDVADRVANGMRDHGFEVKRVSADPSNSELAGDWDLFLTIHYDADVYNDHGGFVDFPEPSTDGATQKSQAIAKALAEKYFAITGIKNVPGRSNKNTRYYYMWSRLSLKTPCVIIECGVGARKPKDFDPLNTDRGIVAQAIVAGLLQAFNMEVDMPDDNYAEIVGKSTQRDEVVNHYKLKIGTAVPNELLEAVKQIEKDAYNKGLSDGKAIGGDKPAVSVDEKVWEPNGLTIEVVKGDTKLITNYKKR